MKANSELYIIRTGPDYVEQVTYRKQTCSQGSGDLSYILKAEVYRSNAAIHNITNVKAKDDTANKIQGVTFARCC